MQEPAWLARAARRCRPSGSRPRRFGRCTRRCVAVPKTPGRRYSGAAVPARPQRAWAWLDSSEAKYGVAGSGPDLRRTRAGRWRSGRCAGSSPTLDRELRERERAMTSEDFDALIQERSG